MKEFRVTYEAKPESHAYHVRLSEFIEADELEDAFLYAVRWADRQDWILKSVEETVVIS